MQPGVWTFLVSFIAQIRCNGNSFKSDFGTPIKGPYDRV